MHAQGLAGATAAADVAAEGDDVAAGGATEGDGPLFFFDAAGDASSAGPDDSLPASISAIVDAEGSKDATSMDEEDEDGVEAEVEEEAPASRRSGRKRGPAKTSGKGSTKKNRATKTKK